MGLRRRVRVPRSLFEIGDLPRAAGDAGVSVPRLFLALDDERRRMDLGPRVAPEVGRLPGPRHMPNATSPAEDPSSRPLRRGEPSRRNVAIVLCLCASKTRCTRPRSGSESTTSCQRAIGSSGPRADARTARCYRRKRVDQAGRPTEWAGADRADSSRRQVKGRGTRPDPTERCRRRVQRRHADASPGACNFALVRSQGFRPVARPHAKAANESGDSAQWIQACSNASISSWSASP
jgi:hypothetical protein